MTKKPMMSFLLLVALGSVAEAEEFLQLQKTMPCEIGQTATVGNEKHPDDGIEWDSGFPVDPTEVN